MSAAPLLVLASVISIQFGSAVGRTLFDDLGATGVVLLRAGLSALVLAVLVRPRLRTWPRAAWRAACLLGIAVAGLNLFSALAMRTVPLGVVVTVSFLGPLTVALVQTRRLLDLLWALLAGAGVALLWWHPGPSVPPAGLGLAALAGVCGAGYIVLTARVGGLVPGVGALPVSLSVATLVALPFGLTGVRAVVDEPLLLAGAGSVALLQTIFPYVLELLALRRIPTRVFGILASLNPAAAAIAGLLVLDQHLGPVSLAALALVTLASAGVTVTGGAPRSGPSVMPAPRESSGPPVPRPRSRPSRGSRAPGRAAWPRRWRRHN
ncbi:DMT transporter permease [Paractinoplanes abujensis]|uniref:Inner membrane transporter RhtA n=1 Tax=Paractinoplanes abujensis TaxID=882441 RepID=A0A7W7CWD1_9ACTN|nr:EamA family transporter [Actinoplanes abujensis]MBB4694488.1 inner membrane transporter RhtA [Actinoplanes abujensis]GID20298.1 DMT transporter permease [Actinoplanes abujensis]